MAVEDDPDTLGFVSDCFKTQEMCNEPVRMNPSLLEFVSAHIKTQEMCNTLLLRGPFNL